MRYLFNVLVYWVLLVTFFVTSLLLPPVWLLTILWIVYGCYAFFWSTDAKARREIEVERKKDAINRRMRQ